MARYINPVPYAIDGNGKTIPNATLTFYEPGTTTPKTIYDDSGFATPTDNPQTADANGQFSENIFLDGIYKVVYKDADDVTVWTKDPVGDIEEGQFELWLTDGTYNIPDIVLGSDDEYYQSIVDNNQGNDPTTSPTKWRLLHVGGYNAGTMDNIGFTATVATKALTFALKTQALADPATGDRVKIAFRDETLTNGNYDLVNVTAATSIVVPDGATLGFTAAEEGYIYLYAISNAGTIELAVAKKALFDEAILHTTVAIDATADSDDVLYSTTLRANVPIRLIGRIKIATGGVAGEWDNAATESTVNSPSIKKTSDPVNSVRVDDGAVATGTTVLPFDDTIPQITEGDEYMTVSITPKSALNKLVIEAQGYFARSTASRVYMALFKDSDVNALAAMGDYHGSNEEGLLNIKHELIAGSVSAITFRIRAGMSTAGTTTFNGNAAARKMGGVMNSYIKVTEIAQ